MLPFCENKKVSSDSDSVHTALTREVSVLQLGSRGLRDGRLAFGGMAFAEKSHMCDHTHVLETKARWQSTLLVALSSSLRGFAHTPSWLAMPGGGGELAPAPTNITASTGPLSPGPSPLSLSCLLSALIASGPPQPCSVPASPQTPSAPLPSSYNLSPFFRR